MEKKNGFTLIELLAVIVILAIIAVIATPIILGVIDDAKKSSYVNSASGILDSASKFIMSKELKGELENNYEIDLTGDTLTYSGGKPVSGTLLIVDLCQVFRHIFVDIFKFIPISFMTSRNILVNYK